MEREVSPEGNSGGRRVPPSRLLSRGYGGTLELLQRSDPSLPHILPPSLATTGAAHLAQAAGEPEVAAWRLGALRVLAHHAFNPSCVNKFKIPRLQHLPQLDCAE